jgi:hypothetical protein
LTQSEKASILSAFRSGKYSQGKGRLRPTEYTWCSLGVIADVIRRKYPERDEFYFSRHSIMLADAFLDGLGLTYEQARRIARLNDNGKSFNEIAKYITKYVKAAS